MTGGAHGAPAIVVVGRVQEAYDAVSKRAPCVALTTHDEGVELQNVGGGDEVAAWGDAALIRPWRPSLPFPTPADGICHRPQGRRRR